MTATSTKPAPRLSLVRPPASRARVRPRHRGLLISFLAIVAAPLLAFGPYLHWWAADQYASHIGFSVRAETSAAPIELFGGLAEFAGGGSQDGHVLQAFLLSQDLVETLERELDLTRLFSLPAQDPVFAYDPSGEIEDLLDYWMRMVRVLHDPSTGMLEVDVRAFSAEDAQTVAEAILMQSAALVERLSEVAQADTIEFARQELDRAETRLAQAREAMTAFRSRTQVVDPSADLQGRMGLLATLQQELAAALIDADLLGQTTRAGDIRIDRAQARIAVIETRIEEERRKLGTGTGASGEDYARIVSEFERLSADRAFAEQSYTLALAAYDAAQAEARRKSRYLAVHIPPTLAQSPQYPERIQLFALTAFFLSVAWASGALIFYSLRDRR